MKGAQKGTWGRPALNWNPAPTMEDFLDEKRAALCSDNYLKGLRIALTHFANYMEREGIDHPADLKRSDIIKFQGIVNTNKNWGENYRKQTMKFIRTWIHWLVETEILEKNPWISIKVGKIVKTPNPLSEAEVSALFAAHKRGAFSLTPFNYHRRELILAIFFAWGLRMHELEALNNSQMDSGNDFVTAINKGGGSKNLPYPAELKAIYSRYAKWRASKAKTDDALFLTDDGERLAKNTIYKMIVELGREAGIDVNPHMLRDTCGTTLLNDNMEVERVAKILGHTNIRQTLAYSEVRDKAVAESHGKSMNPRLKMLFSNTSDLQKEDENED